MTNNDFKAAWLVYWMRLVGLQVELIVHDVELVVRIILLPILLILQILLIRIPIWIVILRNIYLRLKVVGTQGKQSQQRNCQETSFYRMPPLRG